MARQLLACAVISATFVTACGRGESFSSLAIDQTIYQRSSTYSRPGDDKGERYETAKITTGYRVVVDPARPGTGRVYANYKATITTPEAQAIQIGENFGVRLDAKNSEFLPLIGRTNSNSNQSAGTLSRDQVLLGEVDLSKPMEFKRDLLVGVDAGDTWIQAQRVQFQFKFDPAKADQQFSGAGPVIKTEMSPEYKEQAIGRGGYDRPLIDITDDPTKAYPSYEEVQREDAAAAEAERQRQESEQGTPMPDAGGQSFDPSGSEEMPMDSETSPAPA